MDVSSLPVREFTDPATIRLISTACINEPALAPLADTDAERAILEEIEGLTSARRTMAMPRPPGIAAEELLTEAHGYGWTLVNAAFCYARATGNRFSGPERGAWYAAHGPGAAETAQQEVAFHLTRELDATGVYQNVTAYRELVAGFTARFHDVEREGGAAFLSPDVRVGYPAGQGLARAILERGGNGVLYPSVRHEGGQCLAAFRPFLVQNVRPGKTWRFAWGGERDPEIVVSD